MPENALSAPSDAPPLRYVLVFDSPLIVDKAQLAFALNLCPPSPFTAPSIVQSPGGVTFSSSSPPTKSPFGDLGRLPSFNMPAGAFSVNLDERRCHAKRAWFCCSVPSTHVLSLLQICVNACIHLFCIALLELLLHTRHHCVLCALTIATWIRLSTFPTCALVSLLVRISRAPAQRARHRLFVARGSTAESSRIAFACGALSERHFRVLKERFTSSFVCMCFFFCVLILFVCVSPRLRSGVLQDM